VYRIDPSRLRIADPVAAFTITRIASGLPSGRLMSRRSVTGMVSFASAIDSSREAVRVLIGFIFVAFIDPRLPQRDTVSTSIFIYF